MSGMTPSIEHASLLSLLRSSSSPSSFESSCPKTVILDFVKLATGGPLRAWFGPIEAKLLAIGTRLGVGRGRLSCLQSWPWLSLPRLSSSGCVVLGRLRRRVPQETPVAGFGSHRPVTSRGAAGTSSEIKSPANPLPPVVRLCSNWRWPGGTEASPSVPQNEPVTLGMSGDIGRSGGLLKDGT